MSISSTVEKKQLDIILKLNRLTHDGKIQWTHTNDPLSPPTDAYYANYNGRRLTLAKDDYFQKGNATYTLYVHDYSEEEPLNVIPHLAATRDLLATIKRKAQEEQEKNSVQDQLQSLEELNEWLSESEQA